MKIITHNDKKLNLFIGFSIASGCDQKQNGYHTVLLEKYVESEYNCFASFAAKPSAWQDFGLVLRKR